MSCSKRKEVFFALKKNGIKIYVIFDISVPGVVLKHYNIMCIITL